MRRSFTPVWSISFHKVQMVLLFRKPVVIYQANVKPYIWPALLQKSISNNESLIRILKKIMRLEIHSMSYMPKQLTHLDSNVLLHNDVSHNVPAMLSLVCGMSRSCRRGWRFPQTFHQHECNSPRLGRMDSAKNMRSFHRQHTDRQPAPGKRYPVKL